MAPLTYTAKLMSKLKDGQMVKAIQVDQNVYESSAQKATAPAVLKPPTFVQTVTEGSTTVSGLATGLDSVRVELKDGRDVKTFADATPDAKGAFTATFTNPLQADQHLEVFGLSKSGAMSADSVGVDVGSYGLDWGLVRGYFTAGVLMSNNNSQFNLTSANLFLGFNLDKDWPRIVQPKFDSTRYSRVSFHTFFDTRLTAIPTGTSNASGTTPTATGGTGSTTTTGTSTTSTSNLTSLFSNNQAASLQVGAYFPITAGAWDYKDQSYSLFVAPLAKVGFYTVTNAGSTASQALTNSLNAGRFFPFYGYGLRIGHYRNYKWRDGLIDRSRAPEQLSYIDFTVGKWANFETLSPYNFNGAAMPTCTVPTSDPATAACDVRQRLWRYGFEGILVIPNTPLILGLSANVSAQRPHSSTGIYLLPQDDLRFLFGIRFDANRLTGILSKFGVQ
jgi:hypothetical protein